jgi:hypothetical protein
MSGKYTLYYFLTEEGQKTKLWLFIKFYIKIYSLAASKLCSLLSNS